MKRSLNKFPGIGGGGWGVIVEPVGITTFVSHDYV